jgi:hypothetical protein
MQHISNNGAKVPLMAFLGVSAKRSDGWVGTRRPALMPQAFIAAMSGLTPTIFITRVRL